MLTAKLFFPLLVFIVINLAILFLVRTRTTTVISLIISHLVAIIFFSVSVVNYNSFKEITLALVIYSMVILFLISNYGEIVQSVEKKGEIRDWRHLLFSNILKAAVIFLVFLIVFLLVKNVEQIAENLHDKKLNRQSEIMSNPMILPSHNVHNSVKRFYLGKKNAEDFSLEAIEFGEIDEKKMALLKDNLSDNFLLKRSSDIILVIVAVSTIMLLMSRKRKEDNI